jgi:hypothetical protein
MEDAVVLVVTEDEEATEDDGLRLPDVVEVVVVHS